MTELIKIDSKILYALAGLLVVCALGAANTFEKPVQENVLAPNIITFDEDEFHKMRVQEADDVFNIIQNMEAGYVSSTQAHEDIFDTKYWAKEYTTGNAVEMGVNVAYIDYLNSALDCTNQFQYGINSDEYKKVYGEMMAKKELI